MMKVLRSQDRGHANHGWLDSYHTFSFADYFDPQRMGFGSLRVINEDRIEGGAGFPLHPHRDMEIVTYMVEGSLAHRDTLGNEEAIGPGELQRMTAGTGIRHSEFNASKTQPAHLLQIWILPEREDLEPGYEQKSFAEALEKSSLVLAASREGRDGSLKIHQDLDLWMSRPKAGERQDFPLRPGRAAWVQVVRGQVKVADQELRAGDALALVGEERLSLSAQENAEMLIFDLSAK
ncbi:MAG: pirin family protein [Bdellovibrionaceae bacterium]|nr:pirin family protein [Pseudobdellovibrionaceae bacterium]